MTLGYLSVCPHGLPVPLDLASPQSHTTSKFHGIHGHTSCLWAAGERAANDVGTA